MLAPVAFFCDGDTTLFADPLPHFLSLGVDLAFMSDDSGPHGCRTGGSRDAHVDENKHYNSGFFLMRPTGGTLRLWQAVLSYQASEPHLTQQQALNALLGDVQTGADSSTSSASNFSLAVLDESRFLNGFCFYERRPMHEYGMDSERVLAVHVCLCPWNPGRYCVMVEVPASTRPALRLSAQHNFVFGDDLKFRRAREYAALVEDDAQVGSFLRRARAAMNALPAWAPAQEISARTRCSGPRAISVRPSRLGRSCLTGLAPTVASLCRNHTPVALWSMRGAGATWLRIALELSTGLSTGSMFANPLVANAMPSELWPWETEADCETMLALFTTGEKRLDAVTWTSLACGGKLSRAVFLVRHPFAVVWANFISSRKGRRIGRRAWLQPHVQSLWHDQALSSARKWVQLLDSWMGTRMDSAYRVWVMFGRAHIWVRHEDLLDGTLGPSNPQPSGP